MIFTARINDYLKSYGIHDIRLIQWLEQNHVNIEMASLILDKYAIDNKRFKDNVELERALKEETHSAQYKYLQEVVDKYHVNTRGLSFWQKVKVLFRND